MSDPTDAPYEILGAVPPEKMPTAERPKRAGIWTALADKMMTDYQAGFVTVVRLAGEEEYERLKNGIRVPIRERDPDLRIVFATVPKDGKLEVYMRLVKR